MKVAILGSTGSIGRTALQLCKSRAHEVRALACNSNVELIIQQYYEFKPSVLAVEDEYAYLQVKSKLASEDVCIYGKGGAELIAQANDYDVILNAIVGIAGLRPALKAALSKKRLAIANKESLVVFGETIISIAKEHGTELIPVDSEHSAIFQCLQGENSSHLQSVILTASGGPLREMSRKYRASVKAEQALKHPNWSMGKKISIDSATLMNKGLEFIEAMRLFDLSADKIEVVIHPESIIHSAVSFVDGSVIAQMAVPDMTLPIQYAFDYPKRMLLDSGINSKLDFFSGLNLSFFKPDYEGFPCLNLAKEAVRMGGIYPCVLNAANELAVSLFLENKIGFYGISDLVQRALEKNYSYDHNSIDDVISCHNEVIASLESSLIL